MSVPVTTTLRDIQRPIQAELARVGDELHRIVAADFPRIAEISSHLLRAKGKLFRPTLLLLSHQATGGRDSGMVTLAATVELIHLATLVHDDSVDHSALRRGMPTVNALFSHQTAVIMGDYLYSRAIIELVRLDDLEPLRILSRVTNEMTIGEMRQLEAHDRLAFGEADYDLLIRAKTASLLSGACELGALHAAPAEREALRRFGFYVGMAFQIADDMLDYTESAAVTGKPAGQDLREHKVTLPLIAAMSEMTSSELAEVESFFADPEPRTDQIARIIELVHAQNGLEYARRRAEYFGEAASAALLELPNTHVTDSLRQAITYVIERRS